MLQELEFGPRVERFLEAGLVGGAVPFSGDDFPFDDDPGSAAGFFNRFHPDGAGEEEAHQNGKEKRVPEPSPFSEKPNTR